MDKQLLPNIEKLAAYIDGNLSQYEMQQIFHLATFNEDLMNLLDANATVEEVLAGYGEGDLQLPDEITGWDFELPRIENIENPSSIGDSFFENFPLYNQEALNAADKIMDDVFNGVVLETEGVADVDMDLDMDLDMDTVIDDLELFN